MNDGMPAQAIEFNLEFSPVEKARFAIEALRQDPELMKNHVIGGRTPPEMLQENKRKDEVRRQREFGIVAEFGVFDEYLAPLRTEEAALLERLEQLRRDITDVEKLRPKT